ncbi:Flp pilus assembly protein CpaB [Sphingopyxis sp. CCNWLW253]|uniref:Flp pilus assembly protein CpaB n=1 Tax=unclassified Sphingopyxis TaxID=2614943 RepID=UPI003012CD39
MFSGRNAIVAGAAIILGLIVVFLANAYFSGVEKKEKLRTEQAQLVQVLVASQPLDFGTELTVQNTKLVGWPAASLPEGAFKTSIGIINNPRGARVALRPIAVGEPILSSKITGIGGRAAVSALLPEGMRAVAVGVNAVTGVGGLLTPGDVVDVLVTREMGGEADDKDQMTDIVLEKVRVIAIDQVSDEDKTDPKVAKTATLEVDAFGAQKLALAREIGTISLALRNVTSLEDGANLTVTQQDLGSGWRSAPRRGQPQSSPGLAGLPPGFYSETPMAAPRYAAPRAAAPAAPPRPAGPSVEIVRGVSTTTYEVKRHGS